jgi:hypothetical protein
MLTAVHPQTDGLAKIGNCIIKPYLHTCAAGTDRNWVNLPPLSGFASKHKARKMTPFKADLGYNPQIQLDIVAATTSVNSY